MNRKARVAIVGYGVIGRRVADAVRLQPDMEVVGVAGRPTSCSLRNAQLRGYDIFVADESQNGAAACRWGGVRGRFEDLLAASDVLLDCTPSGVPRERVALYDRYPQLVVIVQGGEKHSFGGVSFNAFANYTHAVGQRRIRVISCSSTGITRFVFALDQAFGLHCAFVALARRACRSGEAEQDALQRTGTENGSVAPRAGVQTVLPHLDLLSMSVDVPTTFGHVINFQADVRRDVDAAEVLEVLHGMPRIHRGTRALFHRCVGRTLPGPGPQPPRSARGLRVGAKRCRRGRHGVRHRGRAHGIHHDSGDGGRFRRDEPGV